MSKRNVSLAEARAIGETLGINWDEIDLDQFRRGIECSGSRLALPHSLRQGPGFRERPASPKREDS